MMGEPKPARCSWAACTGDTGVALRDQRTGSETRYAARGPSWRWCCLIGSLCTVAAAWAWVLELAAQERPQRRDRVATLIHIRPPLSEALRQRVVQMARSFVAQAAREEKQPVIVFQLHPGTYSFGQAYDLAEQIVQLSGALTVAYVPQDYRDKGRVLRGHAVLIALACDQIYLAPGCKSGEANAGEENISPAVRSAYVDIAQRRRTVPVALALGMLVPEAEVWEVQTTELVRRYVLREELERLQRETTVVKPQRPLIPQGEVALFTAEEAVRLGIASLANDRADLARALGVPETMLHEDLSLQGGWSPLLVRLDEPLQERFVQRIRRRLAEELRRRKVNLIVFVLDTAEAEPDAALQLAQTIADLDPSRYRTVCYVVHQAPGAAAIVAMSCDQVILHPEAQLGGGIRTLSADPQEQASQLEPILRVVEQLMQRKGRPWSVPVALLDPQTVVYQYRRKTDGHLAYFSPREVQQLAHPDQWEQGPAITQAGRALKLSGQEALRLGVASQLVTSERELLEQLGIQDSPPEVEMTWVDVLLDALTNEAVLWALLLLGGVSLYIEFQTPGVGVGAFVATVCFLLYFWGNYLGGTVGWLEVVLFLCGLVFLLLEVFVFPGFGIFGLGGGLMVLASLVLALVTWEGLPTGADQLRELRHALAVVVSAGLAVVVLVALLHRWLPRAPGVNRMMLEPPSGQELQQIQQRETLARYDHLLGKRGKTTGPLVPSGKAIIEGQFVNVISDSGEMIESGVPVEVVRVHGPQVWVRPVKES